MLHLRFIFLMLISFEALAEPWLASRFSQNCAGCHAPGRKNRPAKDRRCSLSCQGCHLNPNGGGLRNHYGKWNENHWLKSFRSDFLSQKKTTAPYKYQKYSKKSHSNAATSLIRRSTYLEEKKYDRQDGGNYLIESKATDEFESVIPHEDPYFLSQNRKLQGGLDARVLNARNLGEGHSKTFLMSADLGLSYRPAKLSLKIINENRFLGQYSGAPLDDQTDQWKTRSFYGLYDDLPFNSFVMYGIYKPLFGNDHPDHTRLSRKIIATALTGSPRGIYDVNFKALGIGTAPNVPYLNLHIIQDRIGDEENTNGLVINAGLRFVSYGASINYTYWKQKTPISGQRDQRVLLQNLYLTTTLGFNRFHLGVEGVSAQVETETDFYRVATWTVESYLRIWREIYLSLEWGSANSNPDFSQGSSRQIKSGIKAFLLPGVELQSQYVLDTEKSDETRSDRRSLMNQIHIFY